MKYLSKGTGQGTVSFFNCAILIQCSSSYPPQSGNIGSETWMRLNLGPDFLAIKLHKHQNKRADFQQSLF